MINSLSRLVRQVFLGARPQPTSQAMMGPAAAEAAERRENLKRAMEIAFAETAAASEPAAADPQIDQSEASEEAPARAEAEAAEAAAAFPDEAAGEDAIAALAEDGPEAMADLQAGDAESEPDIAEGDAVEEAPARVEAELDEAAEMSAEDAAPPPEDAAIEAAMTGEAEELGAEVSPEGAAGGDTMPEAAAVAPVAKPRAKKAAAAKKKTGAKKAAGGRKVSLAPDDEAWLSDAVAYSLSGEWAMAWAPPEDGAAGERLEEFRAKAACGLITVFGRAEGAGEWEPIKASWWKAGVVDRLSFFMGRENVEAEPRNAAGKPKKGVRYEALKVSRCAIEDLWPAGAREVRDAA